MLEFLTNNYDWIFSGIGSGLLFWILGYKQGQKSIIKQKMKAGNKSIAIQIGGDVNRKE